MQTVVTLILSILFFPITILGSWVVVHPLEQVVELRWGKYRRILKEQGMYWVNLWGRKLHTVNMAQQTIELPKNTVADGNGNPIVISGIVTYENQDPLKVALEVQNAHEYVRTQAMAVLKQVASKYPYESKDGHSLKQEAGHIGQELQEKLQAKILAAGAKVISFELSDLTYAPEIAQSMLIRQQAMALIDARKMIVEGAVEIVSEAVRMLEERKLPITGQARERLVTNLLVVICGDSKTQPMVSVSGGEGDAAMLEALQVMNSQLAQVITNTNKSGS